MKSIIFGISIVLLLVTSVFCVNDVSTFIDPSLKSVLHKCIDARNHKSEPGPEDDLHRQCIPWRNRSCCTTQTSIDAHYTKMYSFDYDHCAHVQHMSEKCKRHFIQDLCFYECSPNVGPWTVMVNQKIRKERFIDVPLCASDCNAWFQDCMDDYTCTDNWPMNFDWIPGKGNRCPIGTTCKTFREVYGTSSNFCETVWDHSWKYTPDNEPCMRLWFDPKYGNPNDKVAEFRALELMKLRNQYNVISGGFCSSQGNFLVILAGFVTVLLSMR